MVSLLFVPCKPEIFICLSKFGTVTHSTTGLYGSHITEVVNMLGLEKCHVKHLHVIGMANSYQWKFCLITNPLQSSLLYVARIYNSA